MLDTIRLFVAGWASGMPYSVFDFYARLSLMLVACLGLMKWGYFVLGNRVVGIQLVLGLLGLILGLLLPLPLEHLFSSARLPLLIVFMLAIVTVPVYLPRYLTGRYASYRTITKTVFASVAFLFLFDALFY